MKTGSQKIEEFVYDKCRGSWIKILESTERFGKHIVFSEKERFLIFISKPEFIKSVEKLRMSFGFSKDGIISKNNAVKWMESLTEKACKNYDEEIKKLLKKFKISSRWEDCVRYFILFNKDTVDHLLPPKACAGIMDEDNGNNLRVIIEVYPDTKLEHINKEWPEIEKLIAFIENSQNGDVAILGKNKLSFRKPITYPKFKNYKEFETHKKVFALKEQGLKHREISKIMGWGLNEERVCTSLARLKKAQDKALLL